MKQTGEKENKKGRKGETKVKVKTNKEEREKREGKLNVERGKVRREREGRFVRSKTDGRGRER